MFAPGEAGVQRVELRSRPDVSDDTWPGRRSMGTTVPFRTRLGNGEWVWVIVHHAAIAPAGRSQLEQYRGFLAGQVSAAPKEIDWSHGDPRGILIGINEDGTRHFTDVAIPLAPETKHDG